MITFDIIIEIFTYVDVEKLSYLHYLPLQIYYPVKFNEQKNKIWKYYNIELNNDNRFNRFNIIKHLPVYLSILDSPLNKLTKIDIHIKDFKNLHTLILDHNEIKEIENLPISLRSLNLNSNRITKIKNLDLLKNLRSLYLRYNKISKIENLNCCKSLRILDLSSNQIIKIENLNDIISLESLYLCLNKIVKIENLPIYLRSLYLISNKIIEINLTEINLKTLNLSCNNIIKIENLSKHLHYLDLTHNSIEIMENLPIYLRTLNLRCNYIETIGSSIIHLKYLRNLDLSDNEIIKIEKKSIPKNLYENIYAIKKTQVYDKLHFYTDKNLFNRYNTYS